MCIDIQSIIQTQLIIQVRYRLTIDYLDDDYLKLTNIQIENSGRLNKLCDY